MRRRNRTRTQWLLGLAAVLALPLAAGAFVLIELLIQVDLQEPISAGQQYAVRFQDYDQEVSPDTGFTVEIVQGQDVDIQGLAGLSGNSGLVRSANVQEGFLLVDGTLDLELSALDPNGGRAVTRTTYRLNVGRANLQRDYLQRTLIRQGVVLDGRRALHRARAMGREDARVMRLITGDGGGEWMRAVRALDSGQRTFKPASAPDGVLGHYGTSVSVNGDPYVWAVMDRNSSYAIGITVDRDGDGVPNADDNCVGAVNANQNDFDGDGAGDECDFDDDDDGVADAVDNCPLAANADQADADLDGMGDACDLDADGDGVDDGADLCLATAPGDTVDDDGCSVADYCPCENEWRNHGAYVKCVAHTAGAFVEFGLLTEAEKDAVVSDAGQSSCGH